MRLQIFMFLLLIFLADGFSQVQLHQLFQDHMVIQRDKPIQVWGTSTWDKEINLVMGNNQATAQPDAKGNWKVTLSALPAGGPLQLVVESDTQKIIISDILLGDVWVCSGQSNMEWPLSKAHNTLEEMQSKRYENIRVFDVQNDIEFKPLFDLRNSSQWIKSDEESVKNFSAVGYFFGKKIHQETGVPIGLIGSSWGGTVVEAWMSSGSVAKFPEFESKVEYINNTDKTTKEISELAKEDFKKWCSNIYYTDPGMDEKWYLPETKIEDWRDIQVPGMWEDQVNEMADYDGAVWYRREFNLDSSFMGKKLTMWLSQIDDHSITWVNGHKVGESFFYNTWVSFTVPDSILKPTGNTIVVRVYDVRGKGGFNGLSSHFDFYPESDKTLRMSTSGTWKFKKGAILEPQNKPLVSVKELGPNEYVSLLYNAMIQPLVNFPIKGAIWYQGESNASRAYQYRELFPALIADWREKWQCGDFPFLFVQLANFNVRHDQPVNNEWAELREAQTMALSLPNTGMATIIDLGEANDIHPRNKIDVGNRLALAGLKIAYGRDLIYSGPMYQEFKIKGNQVVVSFNHIGSGLTTNDGKAPTGFAIAGADSLFVWADAKIAGNTIVVSSDKIKKPIAVRYAWDGNPAVNLYNKEGLPVVPFRTDQFKGVTFGRKQ